LIHTISNTDDWFLTL